MIRLAASICLVPELSGGPFLYSGDLTESCRRAAQAGFDGVELLVPSGEELQTASVRKLLESHGLALSGLGTGAGFLRHRLHLASPDRQVRQRAVAFASGIVDRAGELGAFAIIGSLKGCVEPGIEPDTALGWLSEALSQLSQRAARHGVPVILEPLNRYESNYLNRLDEGAAFIERFRLTNVKLLADLFHMNIEESSIEQALQTAAKAIGHVHFVDSNRRAPGGGHLDFAAIRRTLLEIGYDGFLAVEALPYPDSDKAARQAVRIFRQHVVSGQ